MKMILAQHEIVLHFLCYVTGMILVGFICFRILFIAMGRWIVNLNRRLQNRIAKLKAESDKRKIKQFEDGVERYDEELFLNQCKNRKDGKINLNKPSSNPVKGLRLTMYSVKPESRKRNTKKD